MKIKSLKKILKAFLTIICTIFILVAILFLFLTIKEYKPEQSEEIEVKGISNSSIQTNTEYSIITYNIGYAALDNQNDFFMDGGSNVLGRSSEAVSSNLNKITESKEPQPVITIKENDIELLNNELDITYVEAKKKLIKSLGNINKVIETFIE